MADFAEQHSPQVPSPLSQVPSIVSFSANASLGTMHKGSGSFEAITSFPLFEGGARRMQQPWLGNGSFPDRMGDDYSPEQLILLCLAKVGCSSQQAWVSSVLEQASNVSVEHTRARTASLHAGSCAGMVQLHCAGWCWCLVSKLLVTGCAGL